MNRCEQKQLTEPPTEQEQSHLEPFRQQHCLLPSEAGECRAIEGRYYYNSQEGVCDIFGYGGCGGNQNNFRTIDECESSCGNVQDPCGLPPVYGRCAENITRYYYDQRTDECVPFEYSGCRGNKNNFYSDSECKEQCQRREPEPRTNAPPPSPPAIDTVNNLYFILLSSCFNNKFYSKYDRDLVMCAVNHH